MDWRGEEIAEVLDIARPAAYAALSRAEMSLRKAFEVAIESEASVASSQLESGESP